MRPIRLLLVDDHPMVLAGLRALLDRPGDIEVVGEARTAGEALAAAVALQPDLVLMDMRLPDGSGVDCCREIRSVLPRTRVLFLTSYAEELAEISSVLAGAAGYLLKDIGHDALVETIHAAAEGRAAHAPESALRLAEQLQAKARLSKQEHRALALVVEGRTNREIGAALGLSEKTVRNYLSNAFQKLGVSRRSQAAAEFVRGKGR